MLGENKRELIGKALSSYFDLLDLEIAQQRASRLEAGEEKAFAAEGLREALGL